MIKVLTSLRPLSAGIKYMQTRYGGGSAVTECVRAAGAMIQMAIEGVTAAQPP